MKTIQCIGFYLRLFEGGVEEDALEKLTRALEVDPEFEDGKKYMFHIKREQQAKIAQQEVSIKLLEMFQIQYLRPLQAISLFLVNFTSKKPSRLSGKKIPGHE